MILRKLHEQSILVTLKSKKKKRKMVDDARFDRFAFCYEAYGIVYIHSSPVTNRSVKESKYTVRVYILVGRVANEVARMLRRNICADCARMDKGRILQHLPYTQIVCTYILASRSITSMLSSYRYCLAAIICEPRS